MIGWNTPSASLQITPRWEEQSVCWRTVVFERDIDRLEESS